MSGVKTASVLRAPEPTQAELETRERVLREQQREAAAARQAAEARRAVEAARLAALEAERTRREEVLRRNRALAGPATQKAREVRAQLQQTEREGSRLQAVVAGHQARLSALAAQAATHRQELDAMQEATKAVIHEANEALRIATERLQVLQADLSNAEREIAGAAESARAAEAALQELDGASIGAARDAVAQAEHELAGHQLRGDVVQAQLLAWAASPAQGLIMEQLMAASGAQGFIPTQVVEDDRGVSVVFRNAENQTLLAAVRIRDQIQAERAEAEKTADALQITLKGSGSKNDDRCALAAVAILTELRQRGVITGPMRIADEQKGGRGPQGAPVPIRTGQR